MFFAGSSSQWLCNWEDAGQRQDVAACSILGYRLWKNFSRRPHKNTSETGWNILLHTAPYWNESIPRSHSEGNNLIRIIWFLFCLFVACRHKILPLFHGNFFKPHFTWFSFPRSSSVLCISMLTSQLLTARKLKVSLCPELLSESWPDAGQNQWLTAVSSTELSGLTGLRLRLTGLGDVPRLPGRALSRFFALKDMRVMGSCMCHGHANRCLPEAYNSALSNGVQVRRCLELLSEICEVAAVQLFCFSPILPVFFKHTWICQIWELLQRWISKKLTTNLLDLSIKC